MIVVNPEDTAHLIVLIPRYYPSTNIIFSLYNEATKVTEDLDNEYGITDGNMFVGFDFTFSENSNYQLKISEGNEIVYRGKIFATSQPTENYKLTNNVYYS